jgi:hypothetical protein
MFIKKGYGTFIRDRDSYEYTITNDNKYEYYGKIYDMTLISSTEATLHFGKSDWNLKWDEKRESWLERYKKNSDGEYGTVLSSVKKLSEEEKEEEKIKILQKVKENGMFLKNVKEEFKTKEIMKEAMLSNPEATIFVLSSSNRELIKEAALQNLKILDYVPLDKYDYDNLWMVEEILKENKEAYQNVS